MVKLTWHARTILGTEHALELSKNFNLFKTMTQIAYHGGAPEHYQYIYEVIQSQKYRLEWAMRAVYEQDKESILHAVNQ